MLVLTSFLVQESVWCRSHSNFLSCEACMLYSTHPGRYMEHRHWEKSAVGWSLTLFVDLQDPSPSHAQSRLSYCPSQ